MKQPATSDAVAARWCIAIMIGMLLGLSITPAAAQNDTFEDVVLSTGGGHSCALWPSGAVECWGDTTYEQSYNRAGPYTAVSAGGGHICALLVAGGVNCWGGNGIGQADDQAAAFVGVSTSSWLSCALRANGSVLCWGAADDDRPGAYGHYIPAQATAMPMPSNTPEPVTPTATPTDPSQRQPASTGFGCR